VDAAMDICIITNYLYQSWLRRRPVLTSLICVRKTSEEILLKYEGMYVIEHYYCQMKDKSRNRFLSY
jgi:hypothetical protein